jgi:site-specific recombinase XerD
MRDNGRNGCTCPDHRGQAATTFIVRFGRKIFKRFTNYEEASRFLTGLRFKSDEGTFDARDYHSSNPLGFMQLAAKYLEIKEQTLKPASYRAILSHIRRAENAFGHKNVKEIHYADIEDFFLAQKDVSSKTVQNIKTTLHNFFAWCIKRKVLKPDQMPEFPEWSYELGFRKTLDKGTQEAILDEIQRLTPYNPRAHLAIRWLATYVSLRPGDLVDILEEDIDHAQGLVVLRRHKTSKSTHKIKVVPLIENRTAPQ